MIFIQLDTPVILVVTKLFHKKIKTLVERFKKWRSEENCYDQMEAEGIAVFGMCIGITGGDSYTNQLSYSCIGCKHWTPVKGETKNGS